MKKRLQAYFSGRVQGVGFRFTAREVADNLGIVGWVKNLPDDRVEVIAEAQEKDLEEFLARINHYFSRYISDVGIDWQEATGEFKDFGVRF